MQAVQRPVKDSSEKIQRKIAYSIANRVNTFAHYQKTEEERRELRKIKVAHNKSLRKFYGKDYNRKILNLPKFRYEITLNDRGKVF